MPHIIDVDPNKDSTICQINISDGTEFCLEIFYYPQVNVEEQRRFFAAIVRLYEHEVALQDIKINSISKASLKLTGNIFNALELLKEQEFISESLYNSINDNSDVKKILEQSKQYVDQERIKKTERVLDKFLAAQALEQAVSSPSEEKQKSPADIKEPNGKNIIHDQADSELPRLVK